MNSYRLSSRYRHDHDAIKPAVYLISSSTQLSSFNYRYRIIYYLFKSIFLIGFFVQLATIVNRYIHFDTRVHVDVQVPVITPLPDLVLCFETVDLLNYTKLFDHHPWLRNDLSTDWPTGREISLNERKSRLVALIKRYGRQELFLQLTMKLSVIQISSCIITPEHLFDSVDIVNYTGSKVNDFCSIKNFYRTYRYCYVFSCGLGPRINNSLTVTVSKDDHYSKPVKYGLFYLHFHQKLFSHLEYYYLTLIDKDKLPVGFSHKWITQSLDSPIPRFYRYNFRILTLNLLPLPYESKCINYYTTMDYYGKENINGHPMVSSRDEMYERCLQNQSLHLLQSPFPKALLPVNWSNRFPYRIYFENRENLTYLNILDKIIIYCLNSFNELDCIKHYYDIEDRDPVPLINTNTSIINIDETFEPTFTINLEPKMTLLDCAVQMGACLGTWFGFSIFYHIPSISRFIYHLIPGKNE